jgi:hypothetical protein
VRPYGRDAHARAVYPCQSRGSSVVLTRFISALQCAFGFARALLLFWSLLLVKLWTELVFLRQLQAVVGFDFGAKHWFRSWWFGLCRHCWGWFWFWKIGFRFSCRHFVCLFVFIPSTMRFSRHGLGASSPLITREVRLHRLQYKNTSLVGR